MSYHCTLQIIYWGDEKYAIPDCFKLESRDPIQRCNCITEKYISKKYDSLDEMIKDYHNAVVASRQRPPQNFYFNDIHLPRCYELYMDYIKQLE